MSKENGNCLKMKPTPCIFQVNLNVSEDIGLSENLIHFNSSKSKLINIPVFSRTNIWLEKRTAIGNVEIVLVAIPIKIKNIQVDDETLSTDQKGNSHIQNCNNKNKFLLGVDLSHLPNDQREKSRKTFNRTVQSIFER